MKLIPEFLAGIAYLLRRAGELKIRDQLVVVDPERDGPDAELQQRQRQGPLVDRLDQFLGRGIKGNRVIGATDEKQFAVPVDPASLKLDKEKGIRVRPEHIHAALRELAGIADHPLSKKFPLGVARKELLTSLLG